MKYDEDLEEDLLELQDQDDIADFQASDLMVYSRDWTIGTFYDQIEQGNIDLNPGFQRRNAWDDSKRGKLIESIIKGYPVPEIVLAEDKNLRGSFIVIDGKQRLLTIAGFINHDKYKYWLSPVVKNIKLGNIIKNFTHDDIRNDPSLKRAFDNASLRCTVIANYKTDDVLYDIFYRLNSGSSPLSSQELRQALHKGPFSDYLVKETNVDNVFRRVMNIKSADRRLRDIEVILRIMAFLDYAKEYHGNLRVFLDNIMAKFNIEFGKSQDRIKHIYDMIKKTIERLKEVYIDYDCIGRRYKDGKFEQRFNRVILEVQVFYFSHIPDSCFNKINNNKFVESFKNLCDNDSNFRTSIEGSTKNMENYIIRYTKFQEIVNQTYNCNLDINPFKNANVQTKR